MPDQAQLASFTTAVAENYLLQMEDAASPKARPDAAPLGPACSARARLRRSKAKILSFARHFAFFIGESPEPAAQTSSERRLVQYGPDIGRVPSSSRSRTAAH
jgi:hypothetical protein